MWDQPQETVGLILGSSPTPGGRTADRSRNAGPE
jgi:hypothetical protein